MMNNVQKAQLWAVSMIIIGMILLMVIMDAEWFEKWYYNTMWSPFSLSIPAIYLLMVVTVAEYFLEKDGYKIHVRWRWME